MFVFRPRGGAWASKTKFTIAILALCGFFLCFTCRAYFPEAGSCERSGETFIFRSTRFTARTVTNRVQVILLSIIRQSGLPRRVGLIRRFAIIGVFLTTKHIHTRLGKGLGSSRRRYFHAQAVRVQRSCKYTREPCLTEATKRFAYSEYFS